MKKQRRSAQEDEDQEDKRRKKQRAGPADNAGADQQDGDPTKETEWQPPPLPDKPLSAGNLDTQIRSLAHLIKSTTNVQARKSALTRIAIMIRRTLPGAKARLIGSAGLGLALPTSDVDLTVLNRSEHGRTSDLEALKRSADSTRVGRGCRVIHAKKVSILKFQDAESGLHADVSVAVPDGLTTLRWMRHELVNRPTLHPLMLVLKLYLKQNGWDDPASGGLGSYLLFVMVREATMRNPSNDLGVLLLETLTAFRELQPDPKFNHRLRVLDPCNASNNLGRTFSRHREVLCDLDVRLSSLAKAPCLSQLLAHWPLQDAAALNAASKPPHAPLRYAGGPGRGAGSFGGGKGKGKGAGRGGRGAGKGAGRGAGGRGAGGRGAGRAASRLNLGVHEGSRVKGKGKGLYSQAKSIAKKRNMSKNREH